MAPATLRINGIVFIPVPFWLTIALLIGRQQPGIWRRGEPSAVRTPLTTMMFNCAGLLAVSADNHIGSNHRQHVDRDQFSNAFHPLATHTVAVQVVQQGIKALVSTEHVALGVRRCLKGPAKLKGNMESKAFLPAPEIFRKFTRLNLWAVADFFEALGGFWLAPTKMIARKLSCQWGQVDLGACSQGQ